MEIDASKVWSIRSNFRDGRNYAEGKGIMRYSTAAWLVALAACMSLRGSKLPIAGMEPLMKRCQNHTVIFGSLPQPAGS